MINCYAVPGLGATGEIFKNLELPEWINLRVIHWVQPQNGDALSDYAERLLPQIDQSSPFIMAGFSFGAALAVELALRTEPRYTFIVSGVTCRSEIPFYLKRARAFHVYKLAPYIVRFPRPILRWGIALAFGVKDPTALDLLTRMVREIHPGFYSWGLEALMDWQNSTTPENLLHIQGDRDHLLPARYVDADIILRHGGHFIVYTHGKEIGAIITETLQ